MNKVEDIIDNDKYSLGAGNKIIAKLSEVNPETLSEFKCGLCEHDVTSGNEVIVSKTKSPVVKAIDIRCNHCKQKWHITENIPLPDSLL